MPETGHEMLCRRDNLRAAPYQKETYDLHLDQNHTDELTWAASAEPLLTSPESAQPEAAHPETVHPETPQARLHLHACFASQYLPDRRDILVYVPPGYDRETERSYPVLYLNDGQNLFDPRTSFIPGRTWQVQEHADAGILAGEVEPLLIVGIYNTPARLSEYTHERDGKMGGGNAAQYGLTLTEEILPFIAERYRVRTDRDSTGLGGSSLGGLVTLYLGLRHAPIFGKLAVLSPSVWWNHKSILGYVNELSPQIWDRPRVWLDVGDKEGRGTLDDAEALNRRLKANRWVPGKSLHFERVHGGTHDEGSWAKRVRAMLKFLFPAGDDAP